MKSKVFMILAVIMTLIIWINSLMPASISSEQSELVVELLNSILTLFGVDANYEMLSNITRKLAHFIEFFILGFLYFKISFNSNLKKNLFVAVAFGILVAIIDETIQLFVDGRAFMITDIAIDTSGVLIGSLVGLMIVLYYKNRRAS